MGWVWYLFGFEGRINRAKLWFAGLYILCWMMFLATLTVGIGKLSGIIGPVDFGFSIDDIFKAFDPASYRSLSLAELPVAAFKAAGSAVVLWVYLATSVKRLHDRDKSGWWIVPFFVVPGLYGQFADRLPSFFVLLPAFIASVLCLWGFIEMYFLKGSRKTNRFGANPLLPAEPDPRVERQGNGYSSSGWDQQSEIEMVPHKAGPPPVWHVKPGYE